ncbi:MAG: PIN domain-containing protein [Thermoproteus sp.]
MSCFVLDASALFHGRDLRLFQGARLLTTRYVLEEIRDARAQAALEILNVEVVDIDEKELAAYSKAGLSRADASLLALAHKTGCVLLTDDVGLAKAARRLGVKARGFYFVK